MENQFQPEPAPQHTRILNIPAVIIAIILICIAAYGIPSYFMSLAEEDSFTRLFSFIPALFAYDNSVTTWASLITYSFLHGSWAHLGLNMVWLVVFGSPLANRLGTPQFLLFWAFTAVIAAMTHFILYPASEAMLVGASGAISGLMGAAARYGFHRVPEKDMPGRSEFGGPLLPMRTALQSRTVQVFIGSWLLMNIFIGLVSHVPGEEAGAIAWEAHIGGLLAGFFTIGIFDRRRS